MVDPPSLLVQVQDDSSSDTAALATSTTSAARNPIVSFRSVFTIVTIPLGRSRDAGAAVAAGRVVTRVAISVTNGRHGSFFPGRTARHFCPARLLPSSRRSGRDAPRPLGGDLRYHARTTRSVGGIPDVDAWERGSKAGGRSRPPRPRPWCLRSCRRPIRAVPILFETTGHDPSPSLPVLPRPPHPGRPGHARRGRAAGPGHRGVRRPAQAVSLRLQAAPRDLHRADHRRADLRAEDRLRPPRLPLRRARRGPPRPASARCASRRSGLEAVPDPALEIFFDEILAAPTTEELLVGLYEDALPALDAALARHMADTNPLADAPSVRVCRFARLELADMIAFGREVHRLPRRRRRRERRCGPGSSCSTDALAAAGGLDGASEPSGRARRAACTRPSPTSTTPSPAATSGSRTCTTRASTPRRSSTTPTIAARAKTLMMLFKRLREIDVPEMMASIIVETKGKPWGYYRDMIAAALGRGPARDDGRGRLRRHRRRLDARPGSPTTGRSGSTPSARRSSGTPCSTSSSRA